MPYTIKFFVAENNFSLIEFQTAKQFKQNLEHMYVLCANDTAAIAMHPAFAEEANDMQSFEEDMSIMADTQDTLFPELWDEYFTSSE